MEDIVYIFETESPLNETEEIQEKRQRIFMQNLQKLRGEMSDAELADFLEMKYGTIYQYLTGRRFPSLQAAAQIAEKFGVSIDWLVGINEETEKQN